MDKVIPMEEKVRRGAEDAGRYFRNMKEFVGFTSEDSKAIRESALVIEKHLPAIVAAFYTNLLRYPPTRKHFLNKDGVIDQDYLQKRMHHLTNFWRRTASGEYDDEYARYVDYVGRAHTSHGADPTIYIAERYVIGQVGFMQHAITQALSTELHEYDPDLELRATQAWNKLMMVILETLARVYSDEHEAENLETRASVDPTAMQDLAVETYEAALGLVREMKYKEVAAAREAEISEGERKIVQIDNLSIGIFHHKGEWIALHNHCLHRGGPVATGALSGDTLVCPWHGYQYNLLTGQLLVDSSVKLPMYPVNVREGIVYVTVPDLAPDGAKGAMADKTAAEPHTLAENELYTRDLPPGAIGLVHVDGRRVAVYNLDGAYYATGETCTHAGGPLSEGKLQGESVVCPWHGSCFSVKTGAPTCPPATAAVKTYPVTQQDGVIRVG